MTTMDQDMVKLTHLSKQLLTRVTTKTSIMQAIRLNKPGQRKLALLIPHKQTSTPSKLNSQLCKLSKYQCSSSSIHSNSSTLNSNLLRSLTLTSH